MRKPPRMKGLDAALRRDEGVGLREWLLRRFTADPDLTIAAMADELGLDKVTMYRWLDRLELGLGAGPRLVDLRVQRELAATGTEG